MIFGNRWRTLAWNRDTGEKIEQHSSDNGLEEFDELVIGNADEPAWFHLEQMNDNDWWFSFYIDNDRRIAGNMHVTKDKREFDVWLEAEGKPDSRWSVGRLQ